MSSSLSIINKWMSVLGHPTHTSLRNGHLTWGFASSGIFRVSFLDEDRYKVELLSKKGSQVPRYESEMTSEMLSQWFAENEYIITRVINGA